MSQAYRSPYEHLVGNRLDGVRRGHRALEPFRARLRSIEEARVARALAGFVGLVGSALVVALACRGFEGFRGGKGVTTALLGSSAAMVVTYIAVRLACSLLARLRSGGPLPAWVEPQLTGRLGDDLALLEKLDPVHLLDRHAGGRRTIAKLSLMLPLAAFSLLMPLTIHFGFYATLEACNAVSGSYPPFDPSSSFAQMDESFGEWIRISLVLVGHAHIALMVLALRFGSRLATLPSDALAMMNVHAEWGKALGIAVVFAAVPGIVFLCVPPILSAITGLVFVPALFILLRRRAMNDRSTIDMARICAGANAD